MYGTLELPARSLLKALILSPARVTLSEIWFSSTTVVASMVFQNVGPLEPAMVVLNDSDIGLAFDDYHEHQSHEFSLEQHSPFR